MKLVKIENRFSKRLKEFNSTYVNVQIDEDIIDNVHLMEDVLDKFADLETAFKHLDAFYNTLAFVEEGHRLFGDDAPISIGVRQDDGFRVKEPPAVIFETEVKDANA